MQRVFAIGDVHGCSQALETLAQAIAWNAEDVIVMLGDYVNRGPDSKGVIDRLIEWRQRFQLVCLLGNHEEMMLKALDQPWEVNRHWPSKYRRSTLDSYDPPNELGASALEAIPEGHWNFLRNHCVEFFETESHIFVHANLYPDLALAEQPGFMLRWEHLNVDLCTAHHSGKVVVCGHSSQKNGRPLNLGHTVCLDTYAHGGGWLTCMEVNTGRLWRTDQWCNVEERWLDDF